MQYFHPTLNIFQSKPKGAFIHFLKVILCDASTIVVEAQEESTFRNILGDVHEAGVAVFQDVIDEFLHHTKYK